MRQPLGLYLVTLALLLTWPLHIGAVTFILAEFVGEHYEPHKDHVLYWFAGLAVGGLLTLLLVVGIFMHRRFAFYFSAFVFLGGLWTLSRFPIRESYDWLLGIALALLLVLSAFYLLWRSRHLKTISYEKAVA
jgi:hypothetical protein